MSTSRNPSEQAEDQVVNLLSHWLARHVDDDGLRSGIEQIDTAQLHEDQAEAVDELLAEFAGTSENRGELEKLVRETLEAVALGD